MNRRTQEEMWYGMFRSTPPVHVCICKRWVRIHYNTVRGKISYDTQNTLYYTQ